MGFTMYCTCKFFLHSLVSVTNVFYGNTRICVSNQKNKNKTLILNDDDYNVAYVVVVFKIFFAVSETAKI